MATKKAVPMKECIGIKSPMLRCSGLKKETDFYASWSPFQDGSIPYCKECCEKIFKYYLEETRVAKTALYYTCAYTNQPFIKEVYEWVNDQCVTNNRAINFGTYINAVHKKTTMKEVWREFANTDVDIAEVDGKIKTTEIKQREIDEFIQKWGDNLSADDYRFLDQTYERYTCEIEELSVSQSDLFKDLCMNRLMLRHMNAGTYNGDETLDKVQKRITSLMSILKIDNFANTQKRTLSEQSFIEQIRVIEETRPAEFYKDKKLYKDFFGLKKYYTDLVLRPTLNCIANSKDFDLKLDDIGIYNLDNEEE